MNPGEAALLRVYTDEEALVGDRSLAETLVLRARSAGLAGATVLRGRSGFGAASRMHKPQALDLRDNLPVVVEIVDLEPALRAFATSLADLEDVGLVTLERVEVLRYGGHPPS